MAQQLSRSFNFRCGHQFFPRPKAVLGDTTETSRIKSLRNPANKMSKSDPDWRSCIYLEDEPDVIVEKCKKAITDFTSEVTYDPEGRPGVANLIAIHCGFTGQSPEEVCEEAKGLETAQYKLRLADVIVENLAPDQEGDLETQKRPWAFGVGAREGGREGQSHCTRNHRVC